MATFYIGPMRSTEDTEQQVRESEVDMNPPKRLRTTETLTGGKEREVEKSTVDVVGDDDSI